jgi:hypothetical protein
VRLGPAHSTRAARARLHTGNLPDQQAGAADQDLLKAERHAALCAAFTHLPLGGQHLIALLIADPPVPYTEISARLGIPVGSIGPNRSRCLDKLRRDPAIAALVNAAEAARQPTTRPSRRPAREMRANDLYQAVEGQFEDPAGIVDDVGLPHA